MTGLASEYLWGDNRSHRAFLQRREPVAKASQQGVDTFIYLYQVICNFSWILPLG